MRLFIEKGYEHTSIQDIIDELGGLTKGAVYHHFKSKEDILLAGFQEAFAIAEEQLRQIREEKGKTGHEKLQSIMSFSLDNPANRDAMLMAPDILKNSKLLAIQLRSIMADSAPKYIRPVLEEGIADGSIKTEYPEELAEVMLILSDIWLNPLVFPRTPGELHKRLLFFSEFLRKFGINVTDSLSHRSFMEWTENVRSKKS